MRKLILVSLLVMSLICSFASCTNGGNVESSSGQATSSVGGAGTATSNVTSNMTSSNTSSDHSSGVVGGLVSDAENVVSDIGNGINSMT